MICLECGKNLKWINHRHLKNCSDMTIDEYKQKHSVNDLMSDETKKLHQNYRHSEERKQKISKANKGQEYNKSRLGHKESPEAVEKRKASLKGRKPGFGGRNHSKETKLKYRELRIADLNSKFPFGWTSPNYNKKACKLFDEINKSLNWNGMHAENGKEKIVLGYFLDFYEPTMNVVIEFDEPGHQKPQQKIKDMERQKEITLHLDCKFFRINQGEEHLWKEILKEFF